MKVFYKEDVISTLNEDAAVSCILLKGYFANTLSQLEEVVQDESNLKVLNMINPQNTAARFCATGENYALFLPGWKVFEMKAPKSIAQCKPSRTEFKEFKDSFIGEKRADYACDLLNGFIKNHPTYTMRNVGYLNVYNEKVENTQTCIFAEFGVEE